ncbi:MAG: SMP-30/gluconolactonase/LRE family protein, partial [Pirellulaceae bacterium]
DLDLPGIWKIDGDKQSLYVRGTKFLRKPMNRPWCVVPHPDGGILVGDSATREIYAFPKANDDGTPLASDSGTPLTSGYIGIPMAIAVSPDKKTIYVGDAEKRALFAVPIEGGKSELIARVNARGLAFDADGNLWAVTPDAEAVYRIDVKEKKAEAIVKDRPYQMPGGLTWAGDHGYVSDVYDKSIWKFTADGKTEKWYGGDGEDALGGPVGLAVTDDAVLVADPKKKQTLQIDRKSKAVTSRMK